MKQGNTWVFVARVSSRNQEFIYMVPYVIEALGEAIPYRVFKVLVSTDIASEGLNLQEFNIVVTMRHHGVLLGENRELEESTGLDRREIVLSLTLYVEQLLNSSSILSSYISF